jgi:GT2 family glycosyltransferase
MQNKENLSIVIVYSRGVDMLFNCLDSIYRTAEGIALEIIIVFNCAPSEDITLIEHRYPEVKTILLNSPVGFSKASNLGFGQAKADYILWLNSDTIVKPGAINLMLSHLKTHPKTVAVGPMILSYDGEFQSCFSDNLKTLLTEFIDYLFLYRLFPRLSIRGICWGKENIAHKTNVLPGSCLALRREVFKTVGLLDENYFFYMEEFDWGLRIRKAGWDLFYLPQAKVKHLGGGTLKMFDKDTQTKFRLLGVKCKFYYFRKHFGKGSEKILALVIFISSSIRVIIYFLPSLLYSRYKSSLKYDIENIKLCLRKDRTDAARL